MNSFLNSSYLDWHYRSRDESLINFSNRHIYQNRLVTFPGPGVPPAISHVLVKQFGVDGQEESSSSEVQTVVSLVLEHARNSPELSLGVITMGIRHMTRVQAALDHALEEHPEIANSSIPAGGNASSSRISSAFRGMSVTRSSLVSAMGRIGLAIYICASDLCFLKGDGDD